MVFLYALLCILCLLSGIAGDGEVYAVKLLLVGTLVVGKRSGIVLVRILIVGEVGEGCGTGISTDIIVFLEVRGLRDDYCCMCSVVYHKLRSVYGSICCTLLVDGGLAVCYRSVAVGNAYVSAEVEHVANVLALFACHSIVALIVFSSNKVLEVTFSIFDLLQPE